MRRAISHLICARRRYRAFPMRGSCCSLMTSGCLMKHRIRNGRPSAAFTLCASRLMNDSPLGRSMGVIREKDVAVEASGIPATPIRDRDDQKHVRGPLGPTQNGCKVTRSGPPWFGRAHMVVACRSPGLGVREWGLAMHHRGHSRAHPSSMSGGLSLRRVEQAHSLGRPMMRHRADHTGMDPCA